MHKKETTKKVNPNDPYVEPGTWLPKVTLNKWTKITLYIVENFSTTPAHNDFYQGFQAEWSGKIIGRPYFTKKGAELGIAKEKRDDVDWGTNTYSIKKKTIWTRGLNKPQFFSLTEPRQCSSPCSHCRVNNQKGLSFINLMRKLGTSRQYLSCAEMEKADKEKYYH